MGEEAKQEPAPAETKSEEKKEEEKPAEEKKEEEKPAEEAKPPSPVVLFVDLHCVGCAKKIERSIMKFRGVEEVVLDMSQNQVTIKGIVEPQAVCMRIMKKTKRRARVLSPLPAAEGEPIPSQVVTHAGGLTTVELNVNMHCEACAQQLKKKILKMRGVQTAETETSTGKVTVTGTMDADRLVDYVYRRTKKQARIIPQPEPEPEKQEEKKEEEKPAAEEAKAEEGGEKKEENGEKKGGEEKPNTAEEEANKEGSKEEAKVENGEENQEDLKKMMYYYQPMYVIERIPPAPQLFSDENPNACTIF